LKKMAEDTLGTENQDDPLAELTDEELAELVENTVSTNEILQHETEMFEKYIKRITMVDEEDPNSKRTALDGKSRKKAKAKGADKLLQLTADQKCDIAQHETDVLVSEMEKMSVDAERMLDNHTANLEELDIRMNEIKKYLYEFERDIIKGAVNPRTKGVLAEKVVRFYDEKIKSKDTLIEKLRLKNSTLKVTKRKLAVQLKQKEEMGEVLHEVDFSQLKIENQQYMDKIDEKNQELLRSKLMAGNTLQVLNKYRKKMNLLTLDEEQLKADIKSKNEMLQKLEAETIKIETERAEAERINIRTRKKFSDYKVPGVQNYIEMKTNLIELRKSLKTWENKLSVAQMDLKLQNKQWSKMVQNENKILAQSF